MARHGVISRDPRGKRYGAGRGSACRGHPHRAQGLAYASGVDVAPLVIERLGPEPVDYAWAWDEQRRLQAARIDDKIPDTVLLLEHNAVYTAGRRTTDIERPADGTPVIDVDRGGRITWHGPGQLVGYPIVTLPLPVDLVAYVRRLEDALIGVCADLGLTAQRVEGRSGVWFPADPRNGRKERKVAAIGVRFARGVTMHGFSLNCDNDLAWFDRIVACGIQDAEVTTLSAELGRGVSVDEALPLVEKHLRRVLAPADADVTDLTATGGTVSVTDPADVRVAETA
jgi:lipoyl(octanoyl) transferase